MRTKIVIRVLVVVWAIFCVRAATVSWTDHDVPVTAPVEVSKEHPDGIGIIHLDYRCPAPLGGEGPPRLLDPGKVFLSLTRTPCGGNGGRAGLFYLDVVVAVVGLGCTFAGLRSRARSTLVRA